MEEVRLWAAVVIFFWLYRCIFCVPTLASKHITGYDVAGFVTVSHDV